MVDALALVEFFNDRSSPEYSRFGVRRVRDSLRITPSFGAIWYTDLDLGFPEIRADVQENPEADGSYDTTAFHGARSVALTVRVLDKAFSYDGLAHRIADFNPQWDSAAYWLSVLGGWMAPSRRFVLYFRLRGQSSARFMQVRPAGMSAPSTMRGVPGSVEAQIQFVCPSGKILSFDESPTATVDGLSRREVRPAGLGGPGLTLPLTLPLTFPEAPRGTNSIVSHGTVPNGFIARIHSSPAAATADPRLTLRHFDAAGTQDYPDSGVGFTGLTVPAGEYVEIDTIERTAYLNGDRTRRVGQYLARPYQWPVLRPGRNDVILATTGGGAGLYAEVLYHDATLT